MRSVGPTAGLFVGFACGVVLALPVAILDAGRGGNRGFMDFRLNLTLTN